MSIGVNASYGLAAGINAGAGAAIYAAQSLAARVAATMRNALKIHSPSRVMRDEIGRFIPQGLALGIEKESFVVDRALRNLIDLPKLSAESAIGTIGKLSVNNTTANTSTSTTKIVETTPQESKL